MGSLTTSTKFWRTLQLDKPVEKLLKNKKLYSLIDKFTEVDLHPDVVDNHTMGSVFELLRRFFRDE